jgi:CelD/BcsL family acetyltransferase involved in cellulose biosynthesis
LLREIPEDDDLRRQWNALAESVEQTQVFYTYEWALAVQRAYGETLRPLVVLAYREDGTLCGIAALATESAGRASFLCATTGDYCDFLSSTDDRVAFVGAVMGELEKEGVSKLALANLPADSATLVALRHAAKDQGYYVYARSAYECAQIPFERLERRKDGRQVAPGLKRLQRFKKAMGPDAPVGFDHSSSWESVGPILPEFMQAHVARFLEIGRISNIAQARRRMFLEELAKLLAEKQWIVLSRMLAGERTVAWHYGFKFHGTWFWYQPTFDSWVEKHWPGFCLLSQVIQEAADDPSMHALDLGLGSEAYKAKFANASRETLYVTLHRSLRAHLQTMVRYQISEAVRSAPAVDRFATRMRLRMAALRRRVKKDGVKTIAWAAKRLVRLLWLHDTLYFYELTDAAPANTGGSLKQIGLHLLADAAMQNADDEDTLEYLLRCARRLKTEPDSSGYALADSGGQLLHFTWARPFENFRWTELNSGLPSPAAGSIVIFDSWAPEARRGRGFYAPTLSLVAAKIRQQGKRSWGFSASTNVASVRGLEKAGFQRSFLVTRTRALGWQKIRQHRIAESIARPTECESS